MADVDTFASLLLEEAKRFVEKASGEAGAEGKAAYLHAALSLAFSALEAHVNSIADDFLVRSDLTLLDRSILAERDVQLDNGQYALTDRLRMYRLKDRIEFLCRRFGGGPIDKSSVVWSGFKSGLNQRHRLTHPKEAAEITEPLTRQALTAIIGLLDLLYRAIYKRPYPAAKRGLDSNLSF
jgi:hypothetical protein